MTPVTVDVLAKSLSFAEERHRIIANNIANANTPFFKAKRAPVGEFQRVLAQAIDRARESGSGRLELPRTINVALRDGALEVKAVEDMNAGAILRHDQNNVSLEQEMGALAENTLMYRVFADLLRKQFAMLRMAIRERVD